GIEFNGPCAWASRYRGRPLTFVALVELSNAPTIEDRHVFQVTAKGERFVFRGYALFTPEPGGWTPCGFGQSSRPVRESTVPDEASVQCINQLKLIGLAFRTWALDHEDRFPFNVSTNAGGTLECCVPGDNGFDANTAAHFQVMSNEVGTASTLVCPADTSKRAANGFQHLQAANVTYFVRSGKGVDETNPQEILVRCPIHGHVGLCDGSIKKGTNK
ncbi:MAG TPA: hypothetical protein VNZ22_18225, partial [Bacillota bacterium]|nr:hypothetical protein [Bacillota bacterium]